MDALRSLYESLGHRDVQTYIQSGNVVSSSRGKDLVRLRDKIETGIERTFGFRTGVMVRSLPELRDVIARNPFARRSGIEPNKLLVHFLTGEPGADAAKRVLKIKTAGEELRLDGREMYIYFPNGMGRSKVWPGPVEKTLQTSGTGRNWNTVMKLLEMAEKLEFSVLA
jgi:uncharacterized protein (DUF1697 family)